MGGLSITGYVLEPPRVGAANSPYTQTPNIYVSDQSAFDTAYPSDESAPRTEYHVFALIDGDFPDCTFCWTKNETINHFDYDGQQQRFKTMPGAVLDQPGILGPTANSTRLVVAPPLSPDFFLYPIRLSVGSGVGTAFTTILVTLDSDLNNPDPPVGFVQVSRQSGKLGWAPADLVTYNGQDVRFQRQSFYTTSESNGRLGLIEDTLLLNPLPAPGKLPLIRIGFGDYLTPIGVASLGVPVAGTVEWAQSTGELRFNAADAAANPGKVIYYDGSCFGYDLAVSTTSMSTVNSPGSLSLPLPPEESDLFFRLPGATPLVQFAETRFVDALSSFGQRGTVEVRRSDGLVQFSFVDKFLYGSLSVEAVVPDLDIERGMTLRMFRTPVDLQATDDDLKDVSAFHKAENAVWASPIIGTPQVLLPAVPVENRTIEAKVTQGTGTFQADPFNRLDVASPLAGYGYVLDLEERLLFYARRLEGQLLSASTSVAGDSSPTRRALLIRGPFGSLQLPNPLVFESNLALELEDDPGGGDPYPGTGGWTDLDIGVNALFDSTNGLIIFVSTSGVLWAQGSGATFAGTTFTDLNQDFAAAGAQPNDLLFVTAGTPSTVVGVYTVGTVGTTSITTDISGGAATDITYEIRRNSEVLADRYFKEVPAADPNTRVERLWNLGTTANSPRLTIDTAYLSATRFRFGTATFSTSVVTVPTPGSFTAPASLAQGTVEVAESNGELNFSQDDVDAGLDVYWSRALEIGVDYNLQPALGFIDFTDRMLEEEEIFITYVVLDDDGNRVTVEERGAYIVRKEVTADHLSPTSTLSFNPLGREVASNPAPAAFRGGRPQRSTQVNFDLNASTATFIAARTVTDALPSGPIISPEERVYIDYYIHGAIGGEKSLTVLQPPMVGAIVNIEADQDRFVVLGDQTSVYKINHLLRVDNSEIYLIGSSAYDAGSDLTTVVLASPQIFRSDLLNPSLDVTSGATRTTPLFFFPSYFMTEMNTWSTTPRGASKLYISGDLTRTYRTGTVVLFTDGGTFLDFNSVTGASYNTATGKTEVVLTSNGARQYNPSSHTLKHSRQPVLEGSLAEVTTANSPVLTEPYLVYRRIEGEAGQILVEPDDYTINNAGRISFADSLQDDEELVILYTGLDLIGAGRRVRATYTHGIAPTAINGLLNQVLKATEYTTYSPDTFYWRVETFTNFRGELTEQYEGEAQATIPTGGPVLENASQPQLYEQGRESLFYEEGRLYNEDEVARPTLKYYNDAIDYLEDALQHMDGRVVGDHNGRFLFDGNIDNPVRATYAAVTNQIDDILKVAEPPLQFTLVPFTFTWLGTYQEAYKAANFSRFYTTYRNLYGVVIAGVETGDTILDTGATDLSSVTGISRRLPWAIVTRKAAAGTSILNVDSTAKEEDLVRPEIPDPTVYRSTVVVQDRDGTWLVPNGVPPNTGPALDVASKTTGSITLSGALPVDVPVGATVYHIPNYDPVFSPSPPSPFATPNFPYLKHYRVNFDVGADLKEGSLRYIKPFPPLDGSLSPSPIPDELVISPPVQEEILDTFAYVTSTLTEPFRFPALDGGSADDDNNRGFPLLTPSPDSELGTSKTQNGSANPDIGYLPRETTALANILLDTTDPYVGTGSLDVTRLILTNSVAWPAPAPKAGDMVEILTGLNALSTYYRVTATTASTLTVATPFPLQDAGFTFLVTVSASLVSSATGTLTTTTQLDDVFGNFIVNGVKPGHTVVVPALGERRQVVTVVSGIQLIVTAFSGTGAVTYVVDDSLATFGGTNSQLDDEAIPALDGQLAVLGTNNPPSDPWNEQDALERFLDHVFTDVLTSSNGETTSGVPILTDNTVDFQVAGVGLGHFVYIRSGDSAGIYAVDLAGPNELEVDSSTPFPDTAAGISYRIVSALGATITTLEAVYTALVNTDQAIVDVTAFRALVTTAVAVVGDAGAYARRTRNTDVNNRLLGIIARETELDPTTGDTANLEASLSAGDRLYDKRYTWIDARINLEKGILPKKDQAVTNRLKAEAEVLKQLTKLLTLRSL